MMLENGLGELGTVVSQLANLKLHVGDGPVRGAGEQHSDFKAGLGSPSDSTPSLSVTVTKVPAESSPSSPTATTDVGGAEDTRTAETFMYFPLLPAELRLKIWHLSFLPRTVELHTRRTHYADGDRHAGTPRWQSESRNPAALSVSAEARAAALECYTVALPLAGPLAPHQIGRPGGDALQDSDRVLYINLEQDMVVLLGDPQYARLARLLDWFRKMDVAKKRRHPGARGGKGLRRLAMSVGPWAHEVGAATLKAFARTVLADIEEFVLFIYMERTPPPSWTGGRCVLEEAKAEADPNYRRFVMGRGMQFRVGNSWMVVGQNPLKVAEIRFEDGW